MWDRNPAFKGMVLKKGAPNRWCPTREVFPRLLYIRQVEGEEICLQGSEVLHPNWPFVSQEHSWRKAKQMNVMVTSVT